MTDDQQSPDERSRAEKRLDARRAARGLPPAKVNKVRDHLIYAVLLIILGGLIARGDSGDLKPLFLVLAFGSAGYHLVVAAIAQGVREGRERN